jgi:hypothetical protein
VVVQIALSVVDGLKVDIWPKDEVLHGIENTTVGGTNVEQLPPPLSGPRIRLFHHSGVRAQSVFSFYSPFTPWEFRHGLVVEHTAYRSQSARLLFLNMSLR